MRKNFKNFIGSGSTALAIVFSVLFLSGCLSEETDYAPVEVAYVSFYHASPDADELDIVPDNNPRLNSSPFGYGDFSGYKAFSPGNWKIKFTDANNANDVVFDSTLSFNKNKFYSVFIADSLESIEAVVLMDSAQVPNSGKSMIRFVNLSPDAPEVNVVIDDELVAAGILFKEGTAFSVINAATVELEFQTSEVESTVLLNVPALELQSQKYYTIVLQGYVNPPAGNTNDLEVKKILN